MCDSHGIIQATNKSVCQMLMYGSRSELIGKSVSILMDPALRDEHDAFLRRFFAHAEDTGFKTTTRKVYALKQNGRPVKVQISLSYLREQNQVAALLEQVSDESFSLDCAVDGTVLGAAGDDLEHITGYQEKDIVGKNVSLFCPSVLLLLSGTAIDHKVSHLVHASGRTVIVSIGKVKPVDGKPGVGRVTIVEVDRSMEGVLTVGPKKDRILKASLACPTIFGYSVEELEGMALNELFPNVGLKKGRRVIVSSHKEGYLFYVRADTQRDQKEGTYTMIVRHKRVKKPKSAVPESEVWKGNVF